MAEKHVGVAVITYALHENASDGKRVVGDLLIQEIVAFRDPTRPDAASLCTVIVRQV